MVKIALNGLFLPIFGSFCSTKQKGLASNLRIQVRNNSESSPLSEVLTVNIDQAAFLFQLVAVDKRFPGTTSRPNALANSGWKFALSCSSHCGFLHGLGLAFTRAPACWWQKNPLWVFIFIFILLLASVILVGAWTQGAGENFKSVRIVSLYMRNR